MVRGRERTFDTDPVGYLADCKRFGYSAALALDAKAFEQLNTFTSPLFDLDVYLGGYRQD